MATWYAWLLTKTNAFEDDSITICHNFMNHAAINYVKISVAQEVKFAGSDKSIAKDIVSMIADSNYCHISQIWSTRKPRAPANNQTENNSQAYGS